MEELEGSLLSEWERAAATLREAGAEGKKGKKGERGKGGKFMLSW